MTHNNAFPSPNGSPVDNYYLQANIADLNMPVYTGDFHPRLVTREEDSKMRAGLNKDYGILLDTINLISGRPGPGEDWQNLGGVVPPDKVNQWIEKWGNPGAWYEPITLIEFQKHALILYLIYQLFYYRDEPSDSVAVTVFYELLLGCPDFIKRGAGLHQRHMQKFRAENKHRVSRINFLMTLIIDHEIEALTLWYRIELGFGLRTVSLLPIMYYQMGVLIHSPDNEYRKIKKCRNCNLYFWGHGNRLYCYEKACDRRYVYKRKMNSKGGKK